MRLDTFSGKKNLEKYNNYADTRTNSDLSLMGFLFLLQKSPKLKFLLNPNQKVKGYLSLTWRLFSPVSVIMVSEGKS